MERVCEWWVCTLSHFSRVWLCDPIIACQASLSLGLSQQESWSGLPFPPPGDLLDPGIEPESLTSPALAGSFFTTSAAWEALCVWLLFSCSVVSDSLWPHGLQHARLPCPSPSLGACSNLRPLSQWCHLVISSSVIPFCLQSFPASGSFLMSQLFASGGQRVGASASALMNMCMVGSIKWELSELWKVNYLDCPEDWGQIIIE